MKIQDTVEGLRYGWFLRILLKVKDTVEGSGYCQSCGRQVMLQDEDQDDDERYW